MSRRDDMTRDLMAAFQKAEGKPVSPSYVATFVDLADVALAAVDAARTEALEGVLVEIATERVRFSEDDIPDYLRSDYAARRAMLDRVSNLVRAAAARATTGKP